MILNETVQSKIFTSFLLLYRSMQELQVVLSEVNLK